MIINEKDEWWLMAMEMKLKKACEREDKESADLYHKLVVERFPGIQIMNYQERKKREHDRFMAMLERTEKPRTIYESSTTRFTVNCNYCGSCYPVDYSGVNCQNCGAPLTRRMR